MCFWYNPLKWLQFLVYLTGYFLEVHSWNPYLEFPFANKQYNCKRLVCSTVFIEIVPFEKWDIGRH